MVAVVAVLSLLCALRAFPTPCGVENDDDDGLC